MIQVGDKPKGKTAVEIKKKDEFNRQLVDKARNLFSIGCEWITKMSKKSRALQLSDPACLVWKMSHLPLKQEKNEQTENQ